MCWSPVSLGFVIGAGNGEYSKPPVFKSQVAVPCQRCRRRCRFPSKIEQSRIYLSNLHRNSRRFLFFIKHDLNSSVSLWPLALLMVFFSMLYFFWYFHGWKWFFYDIWFQVNNWTKNIHKLLLRARCQPFSRYSGVMCDRVTVVIMWERLEIWSFLCFWGLRGTLSHLDAPDGKTKQKLQRWKSSRLNRNGEESDFRSVTISS